MRREVAGTGHALSEQVIAQDCGQGARRAPDATWHAGVRTSLGSAMVDSLDVGSPLISGGARHDRSSFAEWWPSRGSSVLARGDSAAAP